ncbi:hypothetical protein [Candidatus Nitrospira allomarina]|uniref:Uncharacterized protein n=1 Tax=Candidatus Nitrospira allomarina TaxID=3020900 RepID=A0AA96GB87_9BACT|nr:hypothetical protein [Candidatus Nitrospira allomarina]WNM58371.1 hypothetical protein PP769_01005 [Candidatus Nitrospira allomarina]
MTKSIRILSMQHAIDAATKILNEFSNSTQCFPESQENDSSCQMSLVDYAIQGPKASAEAKPEEIIHPPPPISVTPPADIHS